MVAIALKMQIFKTPMLWVLALSHLEPQLSKLAFGDLLCDWLSKFRDFYAHLVFSTLANTLLNMVVSGAYLGERPAAKVTSVWPNMFVNVPMVSEITHSTKLLFT